MSGGVTSWLERTDRVHRFALALGLVTALVSTVWFFTATDPRGKTARLHADAPYYHVYLPSLLLDHDLDFTDEYRVTGNWYRFGKAPTGRPSNVFGIGPALFELPFFAVGRDLARLGGHPDGFSSAEVKATMLASLWFSLGALWFGYRLLRRRLGSDYLAAVVPILVACGGPVVYYAIRQPGYAHPFATFWIAWFVDAWDASFDAGAKPRRLRVWLGLGALIGLAALARPQTGLWAVLLIAAAVDDLRRGAGPPGDRRLGHGLAVTVPRWAAGAGIAFLCVVPQLLAWHQVYGAFYLVPQGSGFMRWDDPAWSESLFSSRNGLFPWAPLYAISALGLLVAGWRVPRLALAMAIGVGLQAVANGAAWDWWAGGSFGGRRFDSCFIGFVVGLGCLLVVPAATATRRWHRWARGGWLAVIGAVTVTLVIGNLVLAARYSGLSVRIDGGQAAHKVLHAKLPGKLGGFVAALSEAANWPARAWFAHRFGTSSEAYDYVVGSHQLGERYPGLNSTPGATTDRIQLGRTPRKLVGLDPATQPGAVVMRGQRATILVGLNRFGPVGFVLRAAAPPKTAAAEVVLRWHGAEIGRATVGAKPTNVKATATEVARGVNALEVLAPAGTVLYWLDLDARDNPRGTRPTGRQ